MIYNNKEKRTNFIVNFWLEKLAFSKEFFYLI